MPTVSIITSVYNCEKYISEMMDSILAQTYTDWELIIFDDASTDGTWSIISQYNDPRIKKFRNRENSGLTVNLNKALKAAAGTYIARIDGDDIAYPRRLEKQVRFMEQHPDVVLSGCWMNGFGARDLILQNIADPEILRINLFFDAIVFHPTFMVRKAALDSYGIQYNEKLAYAQDYEMEYQLSKHGKVTNIPYVLMKYRFHGSQVTVDKLGELTGYANRTRRLILDELGFRLETREYEIWSNFGLFHYAQSTMRDVECIESIIEKIISANKIKGLYDEKLLQQIMSDRLESYKSGKKRLSESCESRYDSGAQGKYHKMFLMMVQWKRLSGQGVHLDSFLARNGIRKIAIYGMGHIGGLLLEELKDTQIKVAYGIDRNIGGILSMTDIPVAGLKDPLGDVDAVVVTVISGYEKIKEMLGQKMECPILSIEDMIYSM